MTYPKYFATDHEEFETNNNSDYLVCCLENNGICGETPKGNVKHKRVFDFIWDGNAGRLNFYNYWNLFSSTEHTYASAEGDFTTDTYDEILIKNGLEATSSVEVLSNKGRAILREESRVYINARTNKSMTPVIASGSWDEYYAIQFDRPLISNNKHQEENYDYQWSEFKPINIEKARKIIGFPEPPVAPFFGTAYPIANYTIVQIAVKP